MIFSANRWWRRGRPLFGEPCCISIHCSRKCRFCAVLFSWIRPHSVPLIQASSFFFVAVPSPVSSFFAGSVPFVFSFFFSSFPSLGLSPEGREVAEGRTFWLSVLKNPVPLKWMAGGAISFSVFVCLHCGQSGRVLLPKGRTASK